MKSLQSHLLSLLLGSTVMGCASLPAGIAQDSFADYAESVFKHQNQLISRLMMLADSDDPIEDAEFENREQAMHEACALLNEYAEHEISGEEMSWRFKLQVKDSIQSCDDSVRGLESLVAVLVKDH